MYAVIRTGGKQYTVKPGDVLQVEKLEQQLGSEFIIDDVLVLGSESIHIGKPVVQNAKVTVVVTKQARGPKIIVFKKKRRHSFRKFKSHKQPFTELFVKSITSPDGKVETTELQPKVVDMAELRKQRISDKIQERKERVESRLNSKLSNLSSEDSESSVKKSAKKKATSKKAATKKVAKKATKKATTKKVAKKASKK